MAFEESIAKSRKTGIPLANPLGLLRGTKTLGWVPLVKCLRQIINKQEIMNSNTNAKH
jgi:hypothetical protein